MNRKPFTSLLLLLVTVLSGNAFATRSQTNQPPTRQPNRRPNIIFVLADDWGWGDVGSYGNRRLRTPNLDRMAAEGTRFTQFYVNSAVCSPSRAAFMTGRFPAKLGLHHIFDGRPTSPANAQRGIPMDYLDPRLPNVANQLKSAGYRTAHFGKWHLRTGGKPAPEPGEYGFDKAFTTESPEFEGLWGKRRAQASAVIIDETVKFAEANRDRPFYVQAWLLDTHAPILPSEEQQSEYASLKGPARLYYAAATDTDKQVGRLLARLDELGLSENTIVIFSSDNGPEDISLNEAMHIAAGSTGMLRGRKRSIYEGGVRVPFIVRWKNATPINVVNNRTVMSAVDFLPSLAKLAGASLPARAEFDGEDLSSALWGAQPVRTKPLFWEWRFEIFGEPMNKSPQLAVRDGKWKLLMNPDRTRVELYDLDADPMEVDNKAKEEPKVTSELMKTLLAWHATVPKGPVMPAAGANTYTVPADALEFVKRRAAQATGSRTNAAGTNR